MRQVLAGVGQQPTRVLAEEVKAKTHSQVPVSKHFRIEQMAGGIFAVIHIHGPAGTAESLSVLAQYVHTLDDLARKEVS